MIPLTEIIMNLTKEERLKFSSVLKSKGKQGDSKKLALFKLILDKKVNPKEIPTKLYGKENKVAYHQLRKRLFTELVDYISEERFNLEDEHLLEIKKLILTSKHLIENKIYKPGFKLLAKAEDKAIQENEVELLNEIYNISIQFSHYDPDNGLEETIEKLEENRNQMIQESNLNMAYATVKEKLEEYHKQGLTIDFNSILEEVFERFQISDEAGSNYKTLYQLVQIAAASASVTKEYHLVAPFVTEWYHRIEKEGEEKNRYIFFHIKLLYFISNVYFRDKKFDLSNEYLVKIEEIIKTNKRYRKVFENKITVLKALNNNYLGNNSQAQEIISVIVNSKPDFRNKDVLDAMIVASMIFFHNKEYKKVQTIYSQLHASDTWYMKTMGTPWVMNKNLIEILNHLELENVDYAESRLDSFLFRYKDYLAYDNRASVFLKFLKTSYAHPEKVKTEEFRNKFYGSVKIIPAMQEDIYTLSFFAYLKSKMLGTNIYETTLELVRETA